jgi:hypothetical protein
MTLRALVWVKSTEPFSGARSRADRALGPANSQPGPIMPTR